MEELYQEVTGNYKPPEVKIKSYVDKPGYISFVLKELKLIKNWNKRLNLIDIKFPYIKLSCSDNLIKIMKDLYITKILPITPYLSSILNHGWESRKLTIREYNYIVLFNDFCKKMDTVERNFEIIQYDFNKMEYSFLKLINKNDNINTLVEALEKYLTSNKTQIHKSEETIKNLVRNVYNFFQPDIFLPSFYDIIIAVNIINSRTYLKWDDLFTNNNGEVVNTGFYNCSLEVFEEIRKYVSTLIHDIDSLKKEKYSIEWIIKLSTIKSGNDPERIIRYYNRDGFNWNKDKNDFFFFLVNLTELIVRDFGELINKEWELLNEKEEKIWKKISYHEIAMYFDDMNTEFYHMKNKISGIISTKINISEISGLESILSMLTDDNQKIIVERFGNILNLLYKTCLNIEYIYNNIKNVLNFESYMRYLVVTPVRYRGSVVYEIFTGFVELFLEICGFFKDKNVVNKQKRMIDIDQAIRKKEELLKIFMDRDGIMEKALRKDLLSDL